MGADLARMEVPKVTAVVMPSASTTNGTALTIVGNVVVVELRKTVVADGSVVCCEGRLLSNEHSVCGQFSVIARVHGSSTIVREQPCESEERGVAANEEVSSSRVLSKDRLLMYVRLAVVPRFHCEIPQGIDNDDTHKWTVHISKCVQVHSQMLSFDVVNEPRSIVI